MDSEDMKEIKECCESINSLSKQMVQAKRRLNRLVREKAKDITDRHVARLREAGELVEDQANSRSVLEMNRSSLMTDAKMAMLCSFENVMAMYGNDTIE